MLISDTQLCKAHLLSDISPPLRNQNGFWHRGLGLCPPHLAETPHTTTDWEQHTRGMTDWLTDLPGVERPSLLSGDVDPWPGLGLFSGTPMPSGLPAPDPRGVTTPEFPDNPIELAFLSLPADLSQRV